MGSRPQSPGNNGSRHARDPTCISSPTAPVAAAHAGQQRPSCRPTSPRVTLHARFEEVSGSTTGSAQPQAQESSQASGTPRKTSRWALDRWGVTEHTQQTLYPRHLQPLVVTSRRRGRPNTAVARFAPRGRDATHSHTAVNGVQREGEGAPPVTKGTTGDRGQLTSVSPRLLVRAARASEEAAKCDEGRAIYEIMHGRGYLGCANCAVRAL